MIFPAKLDRAAGGPPETSATGLFVSIICRRLSRTMSLSTATNVTERQPTNRNGTRGRTRATFNQREAE